MELEHFGNPKAVQEDGNLGMAMLFEAATEMRKIIGAPPMAGKIYLSEKTDRFI